MPPQSRIQAVGSGIGSYQTGEESGHADPGAVIPVGLMVKPQPQVDSELAGYFARIVNIGGQRLIGDVVIRVGIIFVVVISNTGQKVGRRIRLGTHLLSRHCVWICASKTEYAIGEQVVTLVVSNSLPEEAGLKRVSAPYLGHVVSERRHLFANDKLPASAFENIRLRKIREGARSGAVIRRNHGYPG